MKKPCRKLIRIAMAVLFILPVFFSCSNSAQRDSFTNTLDQIDALINQNQFKDAARELGKAEKMAFSSWDEIGLFRRYVQIQMPEKAEKLVLKALKKNPENPELNAVYTNFLIRNKRIPEAMAAGKILQGTKFGSIYSEAVLRDTLEKSAKEKLRDIFHSAEYFPVYYDAYTGSKDTFWLRNCALLRLSSGSYEGAADIHPSEVYGAEDAYFWALVMYDAQRYGNAVNFADTAEKLYPSATGKAKNLVSLTKISSLLQDSYTWLGDSDAAEKVRTEYLEAISDKKGSWLVPENSEDLELLPVIFTNSAKWSKDNGDAFRTRDLLSFCVNNWKDYVPALTAYSAFAYESSLERKENFEQLQLRDEGLATLEMERYDNRAKIPLSDAISRIDESLSRYKDPLLYIVRLDLKYKTDNSLSETQKTASIWNVLEDNAVAPGVYPELIMEFAMNYLLETKKQDDAWKLYKTYITNKYDISAEEDFWESVEKKLYTFTGSEAEYAAYFAAFQTRKDDAVRLGEYSVFENGEAEGETGYISPVVSDETCINLAAVYRSLGMNGKALDLYGKINGRCSETMLKSLIMYRMALIYSATNDLRNAKRCAEYALSLNSRNVDAKMLVTKLKNMQVK